MRDRSLGFVGNPRPAQRPVLDVGIRQPCCSPHPGRGQGPTSASKPLLLPKLGGSPTLPLARDPGPGEPGSPRRLSAGVLVTALGGWPVTRAL